MGMLKILVVASITTIVGLSYILYEPIPEELSLPVMTRIRLAAFRASYLLGIASGYFGYSSGEVYKATVNYVASLDPYPPSDPSVISSKKIIAGVEVNMYVPKESSNSLRRGIIYFHGGGWVVASPDLYHGVTLQISNYLEAVVISVNYRMSPKHVFPAAVEDCEKVTLHILKHAKEFGIDPKRIALMGDSAGGNLATVLSTRLRDYKVPIQPKLQVLIYPVTQMVDFNTPSYKANADGPLLSHESMVFYAATYMLGDEAYKWLHQFSNNEHIVAAARAQVSKYMDNAILPNDHYLKNYKPETNPGNIVLWNKIKDIVLNSSISPLFEKDLSGLPKAYVSTCHYDVLRDDGFFYVKRLKEAGVEVHHEHLKKYYHAWILELPSIPSFKEDFNVMLKYIDENL